jgi:TPR repeat protein
VYSFRESGNIGKCPFCNSDRNQTVEELVGEVMRRVEANDAASICLLAANYHQGRVGFQQDRTKAMELYTGAAELGFSKAHYNLSIIYHEGGDKKKAKFHWEAAAMAGHEVARYNLGVMEYSSGNIERAIKHGQSGHQLGIIMPCMN